MPPIPRPVLKPFQLTMHNGSFKEVTPTQMVGQLALHKVVRTDLLEDLRWCVSIHQLGRSLVKVSTEEDAVKIAQFLWNRCCLALRQPTIDEAVAKAPPWLQKYCNVCTQFSSWVDPQPFIDGKIP